MLLVFPMGEAGTLVLRVKLYNRQQIENMSGHAIAVYIIIPCVQEIVKGFASPLTSLNQEPGSFSRMY